jgi:hypothetical protein
MSPLKLVAAEMREKQRTIGQEMEGRPGRAPLT